MEGYNEMRTDGGRATIMQFYRHMDTEWRLVTYAIRYMTKFTDDKVTR